MSCWEKMAFDQQSSMSNISGHTCTAVLAGNDTFLTETITQDRKRSITLKFPIVEAGGGGGGGHQNVNKPKSRAARTVYGLIFLPFYKTIVRFFLFYIKM